MAHACPVRVQAASVCCWLITLFHTSQHQSQCPLCNKKAFSITQSLYKFQDRCEGHRGLLHGSMRCIPPGLASKHTDGQYTAISAFMCASWRLEVMAAAQHPTFRAMPSRPAHTACKHQRALLRSYWVFENGRVIGSSHSPQVDCHEYLYLDTCHASTSWSSPINMRVDSRLYPSTLRTYAVVTNAPSKGERPGPDAGGEK